MNDKMLGVKLPARVEECEAILKKEGFLSPSKENHASRVAWANIRDWVDAQMALIDMDMAKIEEVFLPYILEGDKTIYELYVPKFKALGTGVGE